jgi:formate-dependent nitrite reductase cytochrome c552 subunit
MFAEGKAVTYPWSKGLNMENIEACYYQIKFNDWKHAETGAAVLTAQHPELNFIAGEFMPAQAWLAPIATCLTSVRAQ